MANDVQLDTLDISQEVNQLLSFCQAMTSEQIVHLAALLDEALRAKGKEQIECLKALVDTDNWAKPQLLLAICGFACTSALLMAKLKEAGLKPGAAASLLPRGEA